MTVDLTKHPRPPSDMADKFMLRLPEGMRDRIASAAKANNRSMNAEIVERVSLSFDDTRIEKAVAAATMDLLDKQIGLSLRTIESFQGRLRDNLQIDEQYLVGYRKALIDARTAIEKVANDSEIIAGSSKE